MPKERILTALENPRTTRGLLTVVNPGGSEGQTMLMQMRECVA